VTDGLWQHHDAGIAERADGIGEIEDDFRALRLRLGNPGLVGDRYGGSRRPAMAIEAKMLEKQQRYVRNDNILRTTIKRQSLDARYSPTGNIPHT
jgi:hypothetical protein